MVKMDLRKQIKLFYFIVAFDLMLLAAIAASAWGSSVRENDYLKTSLEKDPHGFSKTVALTFDDGPNRKYTERLLDGLRRRGIKASFFLVGECIHGNEELVRKMKADGHLIGVHCMEHKDLTREDTDKARCQIMETAALIEGLTGERPEYVRPPFGKWSEDLEEHIPFKPVFWSVDSIDWKLRNETQIVNRVMKAVGDGDIILLHDEFSESVSAALRIIDNLLAKGYTFVTIDELMID